MLKGPSIPEIAKGAPTISKPGKAVKRHKNSPPSRKPTDKYIVRPDDRLDLAVRKILAFQLDRLREQFPGIRQDMDTEFIHQARVATRRMRSSLRLFRDAVPEGARKTILKELKWLAGLLGAVRDLDVFLANISSFKGLRHLKGKEKGFFSNWIEEHRRAPLAALIQSLDSPRFGRFERDLTRFLEGPLPDKPEAKLALKQVNEAAPALLSGKLEAVMDQGRKVLAEPGMKEFHRLRIRMKRLRYACEFISPAYDGALKPFIRQTVELQDCLGEMQDTVFTRKFIDFLFDDWKNRAVSPSLLFALGEIYQLQDKIADEHQHDFGRIWERFTSDETIGRLEEFLPPNNDKVVKTKNFTTKAPRRQV